MILFLVGKRILSPGVVFYVIYGIYVEFNTGGAGPCLLLVFSGFNSGSTGL